MNGTTCGQIEQDLSEQSDGKEEGGMTKMTQAQFMEILRKHIVQYEKDWNNLLMIGDQRQADLMDGRQKEAQDLLWMLEDVELVAGEEGK